MASNVSFDFRKNNFDLIRILAALQVAIVHGLYHFDIDKINSTYSYILSYFPGVPIFFVVSGFLISASWERNRDARSYLTNRFLRIYPGLWACFLVSLVSIFVFYDPVFSAKEMIGWIAGQLTIVQFFNPDFLRGYGVGVVNGSLWTIPVELQFYLVLPFIYLFLDKVKWRKGALLGFFVAFVAINQYFSYKIAGRGDFIAKLIGVTVIPYIYMFFFGVLLQRNIPLVKKFLVGKVLWWVVAYALVQWAFSFTDIYSNGNLINPLSYMILAALVISFAYTYTDTFGNVLKGNDISYGYYIYHMIFVNALVQLAMFSPWENLALMLTLNLVAAVLSWKFIEKPCLALKKFTIKK